ncbi:ankyrin repeat domain-containing protein [Labilibaculum sp.]|uniref:ankyrin repeat domain-containing protein n=1 Tax=Labilibaculum sp. TaxID=2060723 RepID=UPI003565F104
MKTKKKNIVNLARLSIAVLLAGLLVNMSACNNSTSSKKDDAKNELNIKAPKIDLFAAAFMGNTNAIKQHIATGSNLNAKDPYGSTPLQIATIFGKTEAAIALIEGGANLNLCSNDGSTALHTAAFFCRIKIVESLLLNGADKSIQNNYGSTALQSVQAPFDSVKGIYDQIVNDLEPMGFKLNYNHLESTRPIIAEMLEKYQK